MNVNNMSALNERSAIGQSGVFLVAFRQTWKPEIPLIEFSEAVEGLSRKFADATLAELKERQRTPMMAY